MDDQQDIIKPTNIKVLEASPKDKAMAVGYKFIYSKFRYTPLELRIIYTIANSKDFQDSIHNAMDAKKGKGTNSLFSDAICCKLPLSDISDNPNDYKNIKKAFERLASKAIAADTNYKINGKGKTYNHWKYIPFLAMPETDNGTGYAQFYMHQDVCNAIIDITKGWRAFELKILASLTSSYSMYFYTRFSRQDKSNNGFINVSFDKLQEDMYIPKSYLTNTKMLKERVLDTAKAELDKKANYSFEYELTKSKYSRKVDGITFKVYHIAKNDVTDKKVLENKEKHLIGAQGVVSNKFKDFLLNEMNISESQLAIHVKCGNLFKIETAYKNRYGLSAYFNYLVEKCDELKERALKKSNDPNDICKYLIGTLIRNIVPEIEKETHEIRKSTTKVSK